MGENLSPDRDGHELFSADRLQYFPRLGAADTEGHGEVNVWVQSSEPGSRCQSAGREMHDGLEQRVGETVKRSVRRLW